MELKSIFGSQTKAQEIILLMNGAKDVVRQGFYNSELKKDEEFCQENNLFLVKSKFKVLLKDECGNNSSHYTNKGIRVEENDPQGMFFVYLSKEEEKVWLASYYELVEDHQKLGLILGYPTCCVAFFCKIFDENKTNLELEPTNPWTDLSKRSKDRVLLSHFPCSSECPESIALGKKYFGVLEKVDKEKAEELISKLKE